LKEGIKKIDPSRNICIFDRLSMNGCPDIADKIARDLCALGNEYVILEIDPQGITGSNDLIGGSEIYCRAAFKFSQDSIDPRYIRVLKH
jgi:hypothetical protein